MTFPARVLIASNRLPFSVRNDGGGLELKPTCGGLAAALGPAHRKNGSVWIGWPGDCTRLDVEQRTALDARLRADHVVPVTMTHREVEDYYEGICNTVLWPVLHYLVDCLPIVLPEFHAYRAVNERFADLLAAEYRPGDAIWIHDYHLMLAPALVRARIPEAPIGFFLHTPFPAADVFRVLPWSRELIDGLLGATLIGLQTERDARNFDDTLRLLTKYHPSSHAVVADGREVRFAAYPVGIDTARLDDGANEPDGREASRPPGRRQLFLGIDRLDYTKGISRRLAAFERLIAENAALRERVELLQIAVPSREHIPSYRMLKEQIERQVADVNRRFETADWTPVRYVADAVPAADLPAIYRAADVMLVTSIRDGMNLVAKEFVAARRDEDGVLVLTELAGAAEQLRDALLVNPYSVEDLAAAMLTALTLDRDERQLRMRALRQEVLGAGADRWMERFLADLTRPAVDAHDTGDHVVRSIDPAIAAGATVVLAFSYEAALAGRSESPESSRPDAELTGLFDALSERPGIELHIVSTADPDTLDSWFPALQAALWAEDGVWRRERESRRWQRMPWVSTDWKDDVRELLEHFAARTPGAFVDERGASLRWHYGRCERVAGRTQAQTLASLLGDGSGMGYSVVNSANVLTVRPAGCSFARTLETVVGGRTNSTRLVVFDGAVPAAATRQVLRARDLLISVGGARDVSALPMASGRMVRDLLAALARSLSDQPVFAPQDWMMMPLRTA